MSDITDIARIILDGFDKHYRLFRDISAEARLRFEVADWSSIAEANKSRIDLYDQRVHETVQTLLARYPAAADDERLWPRIKVTYIGLLHEHRQPECAETFYNSAACRVLHRRYYNNEYIFWRPAISTEHLEGDQPTYRCYYPGSGGFLRSLLEIIRDFEIGNPFEDLRRDLRYVLAAFTALRPPNWRAHPNHQIQVLGSLFFRNKAAYIVAREINGSDLQPFVIPILHNERREVYLDTVLSQPEHISVLFSFSRADFMVDMEVPSAYVAFLRSILLAKPTHELYSMLGLQKQAKTLFYRDLHHHLKYSTDNFVIAPGIKGMVMLVFTLPSYPFVFKVIRDHFLPPKDVSRETVKQKYLLVKHHDRVGRLADTLEYSDVAFPLNRVAPELLQELRDQAASNIEFESDNLVIKHVYIERRMIPLNEYLPRATDEQRLHAIRDYGNAIRDMAGANIFPGDMMLKNFGVTRHNRVVFYDYDEICYLTECNFRQIPPAPAWEDEMSDQVWYSVGPNDVFPEQFSAFFFSDPQSKAWFYQDHHALLDAEFWMARQRQIRAGDPADVFPYPEDVRFCRRRGANRPGSPESLEFAAA